MPKLSWRKLLLSLVVNLLLLSLVVGGFQSLIQVPQFVKESGVALAKLQLQLPDQIFINWDGQRLIIEPPDWQQPNPFRQWRNNYQYLFVYLDHSVESSDLNQALPGTTFWVLTPESLLWHTGISWQKALWTELLPNQAGSLNRTQLIGALENSYQQLQNYQGLIQACWPFLLAVSLIVSHLITLAIDLGLIWLINRINKQTIDFRWLAQTAIFLSFWARVADQFWPVYPFIFWLGLALVIITLLRQHGSLARRAGKPIAGWAD